MTKDLTEIVHAWIRDDLDTGAKLSIGYYGPALIERLKPIQELIQRLEGERDEANDWTPWAKSIRAKLLSYGADLDDDDGTCDLAEAFDEWVNGYAAECERRAEAAEQALSASQQEVERLKAALEPFAKVAGPIKGEAGRPTYLDQIMRGQETEELAVTTIFDTGGRGAVLWADDFRKARSALQTGGKEHG